MNPPLFSRFFLQKVVKKVVKPPTPLENIDFLMGSSPSAPARRKVLENADFPSIFKDFQLF